MNRLLSLFLLLSLTLLTAACKKEKNDPEPAADLEGTWQWQRATDSYYDASRRLVSTKDQIWQPGSFSLIITSQTIQNIDHNTPYFLTSPYTREGNTILYSNTGQRVTITELTEHTLTLHTEGEYTPPSAGNFGGRIDTDRYYTR